MDIKLYWAFAEKHNLTLTQTMSFAAILESQEADGITRLSQMKLCKRGMISYLTFRACLEVLYDRHIIVAVEEGIQSNYKLGVFEHEMPKAPKESRGHPRNSKFPRSEDHPTNRERQKHRDKQHIGVGDVQGETVDQIEGMGEEVTVEVEHTVTQQNHDTTPKEIHIYDKCFGASKRVYNEWLTAKESGSKLSLSQFTKQWVMEGQKEPSTNEPISWGDYQREAAYRISLLYKDT
jgi:hypothetical protein